MEGGNLESKGLIVCEKIVGFLSISHGTVYGLEMPYKTTVSGYMILLYENCVFYIIYFGKKSALIKANFTTGKVFFDRQGN